MAHFLAPNRVWFKLIFRKVSEGVCKTKQEAVLNLSHYGLWKKGWW